MAHIRCTLRPHFTGQVGPVVFRNGHGETTDPDMVAYFGALPDEYDVTDASVPEVPPADDLEDETPDDEPDEFEDDDQQE